MNATIQTLLEKARQEVRVEEEIRGVAYRNFEQEVTAKFADLIIHECVGAAMIDEDDVVEFNTRLKIATRILDHFGVE